MDLKQLLKRISLLVIPLLLTLTLSSCSLLLAHLPSSDLPPADTSDSAEEPITLETLPPWSDAAFVALEFNIPAFTESDLTTEGFESYAELDELGRCGEAFALVGPETMPTEEREGIGMIKPSGWKTVRYDGLVDGKYLYNRCHLIGYQLTGENANECNLITGTRYLNIEGMLPFENDIAAYVEETGNHVLYRVTPIFEGVELVARGVVMEAYSVEDEGEGICFHVYAYNVQPHITIDYLTGESYATADAPAADAPMPVPSPPDETPEQNGTNEENSATPEDDTQSGTASNGEHVEYTYVLNKKSMKIHLPSCDGAQTMSEKNKLYFSGTLEEAIAQGYSPCGTCKP